MLSGFTLPPGVCIVPFLPQFYSWNTPFIFKTAGVVKTKRLLILFVLLAVNLVSSPVARSEIEYAVKAPLAPKSLLLDVCVADDRIVTVGERGHILISDDQGKSWRQARVPTQATLTGVYFHSRRLGWAVGHDAIILRTQDGGENWSRVHYAPEEERPLLDVLFLDDKTGFAVGAYGFFLKSKDGGLSWSSQPISRDDFHLNQITVSRDGMLYMAAEAGRIYASEDKGISWKELPSPYVGSFFGILPLQEETILVFGLRGNLFRSQDGGKSWEKKPTSTTAMLTDGILLKNGNVVVVGLSGTVLISKDRGKRFSLRQQPDRKGISAVVQAKDGALVLVGESGFKRIFLENEGMKAQ